MKKIILIVLIYTSLIPLCQAQEDDIIYTDYMLFGRREPASLGSVYSALSNEPIFFNPASVAQVTDNRITIGGSVSDLGNSYMLSWTAPNLSISSATHRSDTKDSTYQEYRKELLKFSFAFSNEDLGFQLKNIFLGCGIAAKWMSDRLFDVNNNESGGNALSIDLGLHLTWHYLSLELTALNINQPKIGDTDLNYARAYSFCARYRASSGFMIAVQGINSSSYAGSDFGINIAAQQGFFNQRLISRVQLTSFFKGSEATMQNISGNVGYRPVMPSDLVFLQDVEISYTLSFLSMPQTIGTHLIVLTKYF